jgi:hypothetical protein
LTGASLYCHGKEVPVDGPRISKCISHKTDTIAPPFSRQPPLPRLIDGRPTYLPNAPMKKVLHILSNPPRTFAASLGVPPSINFSLRAGLGRLTNSPRLGPSNLSSFFIIFHFFSFLFRFCGLVGSQHSFNSLGLSERDKYANYHIMITKIEDSLR